MIACKKCGRPANLTIAGMPLNECWGCMSDKEKNEILDFNVKSVKKKQGEKCDG